MENKEIKLTDHYYTETEIDNFISKTQPFIRAIQPNEDLNKAIDDGWYTVDNSQKNIVNIPKELKNIGTYGVLEVKSYNDNYKMQFFYAMKYNDNFPKIFFRKKTGATNIEWDTTWKEVGVPLRTSLQNILEKKDEAGNEDNENGKYYLDDLYGPIAPNGFYYYPSTSTLFENQPRNTNRAAFFLLLESWGNYYAKQTLTYYNNGDTYFRVRTSSSGNYFWTDWKQVATKTSELSNNVVYNNIKEGQSSDNITLSNQKLINDNINIQLGTINSQLNNKISKVDKNTNLLLADGTNISQSTFITSSQGTGNANKNLCTGNDGSIILEEKNNHTHSDLMSVEPILIDASQGNAKNLNEYKNIGFYYCFDNPRAKYVANSPNTMTETFDKDFEVYSAKSFFLLIEKGVSDAVTYIKQTLSYYDGTGTFIRIRKNSTNWTNWAQIATKTSELSNNIVYQNIKEGESSDNITLSNQKLINDNINTKLGGINTKLTSINSQLDNKINKDNNNATNLLLANGSNISQSTFITSSQGTGNANKNLCTGSNGNIILEEKNNHTHTNLERTRQLNPQSNIGGNNGLDDRDLNNIIIPGWYNYKVNDAKLAVINNIPIEDVAATLEVKQQGASNNYLTQWVYTTPEGEDITRIFYRKKYENNWSEWKELATTSPPNPSPWDPITDISYNETNRNYTQKLWYNRLTGMAELYIRSPYITYLKSASWKRCGVLLGKSDTVYTDTQAQDENFSVSLGQEVREYTPFARTSGVAYLTNTGTAYNNMPIFFVLDTDGQYYFRTQKGFEFTDSQLRFEFYTTYRCKLHRN